MSVTFDLMKLAQGADPDVWITRDGRGIPIPELGDRHLLNIIRLLRRASLSYTNHMAHRYIVMGYPQGEMAQDAWEKEFNYWSGGYDNVSPEDDVFMALPWTDALLKEMVRRGLVEEDR